jgi:hypothetical protein
VIDEFHALPALVFEPKKTPTYVLSIRLFLSSYLGLVSAPVKFEVGLPRFTFSVTADILSL